VRLPLYFLAVSGGTLAQTTMMPALGIGGIVPDLPLILAVLVALRRGSEPGCVIGFALGLAQDALVGGPLGLQALSKALVGFAAGELPRVCLVSNPLVSVLAVVLATLVDGSLRFVVLQLFHYPATFSELLGWVILPQTVYNGVLAVFFATMPILRVRA
jgi:rod shape-determining protein MreD